MDQPHQGDFTNFGISPDLGFAFRDPLINLPNYYGNWMRLANNLAELITSNRLRSEVDKMELLSVEHLRSDRELMLAHVALGFICMGYVWGGDQPADVLPKALAVPYSEVSKKLDLPLILTYADCVLANWKLKNPNGGLTPKNMDLIFSFPGGDSSKGFFIVSLLVEVAASPGIVGVLDVMQAMRRSDVNAVQKGLEKITESLRQMRKTFELMHDHVTPEVFYGTVRTFVSGWRDNPALPHGLLYKGVSDERMQFSGGSAGQSSTIQCFDALLGIIQSGDTGDYLVRMRSYMPINHRRLIQTIAEGPSLREFVMAHRSRLRKVYNSCVLTLVDLRGYHLGVVNKYILVPAARARAEAAGLPVGGAGQAQEEEEEERGTGGSPLRTFLKCALEAARRALIPDESF